MGLSFQCSAAFAASFQEVVTEFTQGRISRVKGVSDAALKEAQERPTLSSLATLGTLSEMCIRAMDTPCGFRLNAEITKLLRKLPEPERTSPLSDGLFLQTLARSLRTAIATNVREAIATYLELIPERIDHLYGFELGWIDAALSMGEAHLHLGNRLEAEKFIERAWAQFLSSNNNSAIDLIHYVGRFASAFLTLGKRQRAHQIAIIGWPAVVQMGKASRYDSARYIGVMLLIQESIGNFSPAVSLANILIEELKSIEFEYKYLGDIKLEIEARLFLNCFSTPGTGCESANLIALRHRELFLEAWQKKEQISYVHMLSIITSSLYLAANGVPPPKWLRDALSDSRFTEDLGDSEVRARFASFGRFIGLLNSPRVDLLMSEISAILSRNFDAIDRVTNMEPFDLAPLSVGDRIVNSFAIQARVAAGTNSPIGDSDVFAIAELANRSPHLIDARYSYLHSRTSSRGSALAFQQVRRLRDDIQLYEKRLLSRKVQRLLGAAGTTGSEGGSVEVSTLQRLQSAKTSLISYERGIELEKVFSGRSVNGLAELQATLSDDERYITSFISAGNVFSICVSKKKFFFGHIPLDQRKLYIALRLIKAALGNPGAPSEAIDGSFPLVHADLLTKSLLTPVSDCLKGAKELVFSLPPDFSGIPAHVLLDPLDGKYDGLNGLRSVPWLGLRYNIRMVSGYQQVISSRLRHKSNTVSPRFFGIGDPILRGALNDGQSRMQAALRGAVPTASGSVVELDELPDTGDELRSLGKAFGANSLVLLREEATELGFRRLPLRSAGILAFATHGLTREEIPGLSESALVLTPETSSNPANDGVLTSNEISRLDLGADLIILSACNSASFASDLFGREAASLSNAFFLAGANATLASLWSVNSDASRRLMEKFGSHYSKGDVTPAQALRLAMISFLNDDGLSSLYHHPRFWAAFSIFGGTSTLSDQSAHRPALVLEEVSGTSNRPGHITQAITLGEITIVAGAEPEPNSVIYSGFIKAIGKDGVVLWKISELGRFFGLSRSESDESFFALAYPSLDRKGGNLEIRLMGKQGNPISSSEIFTEREESPGSALLLSSGVMAIYDHLNPSSARSGMANRVRFIDPKSGRVYWEWSIPDPILPLVGREIRIKPAADNDLWVVVATKMQSIFYRPRLGILGFPSECTFSIKTTIYRLNPISRNAKIVTVLDDEYVTDIIDTSDNETLLAIQRHNGCLGVADYGVSKLSDPYKLVLSSRDFSGLGISGLRFWRENNSILLTGVVTREFDSADIDSRRHDAAEFDFLTFLNINRPSGVLVASIGTDLKLLAVDYFLTGLSSFLEAVTQNEGGRTWRGFGSTADRQLGLTIRPNK